MNEQLKQEIITALDIAYRFKESDISYKSYLSAIYEQLIITDVMQSLPKRLSNEAYKKAKEMNYEDFVAWWDEQV